MHFTFSSEPLIIQTSVCGVGCAANVFARPPNSALVRKPAKTFFDWNNVWDAETAQTMSELKRSGRAGSELSLVKSLEDYLSRILALSGMKVLILDKETTTIISMIRTQSEIISKEVFLVERLDSPPQGKNQNKAMHHLNAVMLIRPTEENINALKQHLKTPKYKDYHIYFTNTVEHRLLNMLAEGDVHDSVKSVNEYYADFVAIDPFVFTANTPFTKCICKAPSQWTSSDQSVFNRNIQAILSAFLSFRMRPLIRYDTGSDLARAAAMAVLKEIREDPELFMTQQDPELFMTQQKEAPLLLILDRRTDPVTPLLLQWTYQAMVHELLGATNCRVDMSQVPKITPELKEIVLSSTHDRFYKGSMYLNFGDLGSSVKDLVQQLQQNTKSTANIETIEDMQKFVDQYPEMQAQKTNVSKHVALMHELSAQVDTRSLMHVSELEQELACNDSHSTAHVNLQELIQNPKIVFQDKLRAVLLYALRYEAQTQNILDLKRLLANHAKNENDQQQLMAVDRIISHAGRSQRSGDLYNNASIWKNMKKMASSSFKGVENIYTQHKPVLNQTLTSLLVGKLPTKEFPFAESTSNNTPKPPKVVVVYIMGGITYEEAYLVHTLNAAATDGTQIMLGGSFVHNSRSFIADILDVRGGSSDLHAPSELEFRTRGMIELKLQ
eukprot:g60228.t1